MSAMKVLYILHSTINGGATISFKNLIDGVVKTGTTPVIVYPKGQYNEVIRAFEKMGIKCFPCRIVLSITSNTKSIGTIPSFVKLFILKVLSFINLLKIATKTNPDIIHTNTGVVHEGYYVAKFLKKPHVWHIREYQTKDFNWNIFPSKKSFEKKLSKSNSVFITKDLQKYFNQEKYHSKVIYNPIYDSDETVNINSCNEKYFLIANRISKEKGIDDIIKGYALFCHNKNDYKLKIAGFGDEKYIYELKNLCAELNVSDYVDFIGFVSEMRELIYNAKVLFVGSYYEAFGRMTAEANLLGTFVIGRNSGGTKEILELTHGGYLFDNYEEIPSLLNNYLNTDVDMMGEAKQIALTNFSKKNHCDKIMKVYNEIADKTLSNKK